jgi:hypothetical protein
MNIRDRDRLYRELRRVLKASGRLVFYDPIRTDGAAELIYPVPWAATPEAAGSHAAGLARFAHPFFVSLASRIVPGLHKMNGNRRSVRAKRTGAKMRATAMSPARRFSGH